MRYILAISAAAVTAAQDLDVALTEHSPRTTTVLDQVENPSERKAFQTLYRETDPLRRRSLATVFLKTYPSSWLLTQIYEAASKASLDLNDVPSALFYGKASLDLYPENPLLLVPLSVLYANRGEWSKASSSAQNALEYLDRFLPPAGVDSKTWMKVSAELRSMAQAVVSRAAQHGISPDVQEPRSVVDSAYAGSASCVQCHPQQHSAWRTTGMANMLLPIDRALVIGDFNRTYTNGSGSVIARMGSDSGRLYFDLQHTQGEWDRYRVDFTIGSKWQQAYASRTADGDLHVLPLQYNRILGKWINYWQQIDPPGSERAELGDFHRLNRVTSYRQNCAPCHTSQVTESSFREPGVNCEMCHGPMADHVAGKPLMWTLRQASHREAVQVCAQCHAQSAIRTTQAFPPIYRRRPYVEFSRKAFYRDGRFRETTFIVEAFERSACYRKGEAQCASCHDPHPHDAATNPTSLRLRDDPDRMCLQCHDASFASVKHTHHPADNDGARCVSCHMPKIMNSLLFKAASHQISDKPNAAMTQRFGQQESPNACQICHTEKDAAWTAAQLRSW